MRKRTKFVSGYFVAVFILASLIPSFAEEAAEKASKEEQVKEMQERFEWWPTDAKPMPVKDKEREGYLKKARKIEEFVEGLIMESNFSDKDKEMICKELGIEIEGIKDIKEYYKKKKSSAHKLIEKFRELEFHENKIKDMFRILHEMNYYFYKEFNI